MKLETIYERIRTAKSDAEVQILEAVLDRLVAAIYAAQSGNCDECGASSSLLRACKDSSGISGRCCSRCASQPSYDLRFFMSAQDALEESESECWDRECAEAFTAKEFVS